MRGVLVLGSSDRVRIGAIGAGWWACTNHFPLLAARQDVELVAVCSPEAGELELVTERFGFAHAVPDHRELLGYDLDAVIVASPHDLHHEHAAAALDVGCAVLCEKPMTLNAADAWDLVARSRRASAPLLISYGWNYKPFLAEAMKLMGDPGVGDIEYAYARMASPTRDFFSANAAAVPASFRPALSGPNPDTWQNPKRGGGYIHGQLTHSAALLLWLSGLRAQSVTAMRSAPGSQVELYTSALVDFGSGAAGALLGAGTLPNDDKFQIDLGIFGSEGVLLVDVDRERVELRRHDGFRRSLAIPAGAGDYSCEGPVQRLLVLARDHDAGSNSPGELGARTVELLDAIHRSAADPARPVAYVDQSLGDKEGRWA
jgi:predicted dehydrogenase